MDPQPNVKGWKRKHFWFLSEIFSMQNNTCAGKHLSNISRRDGDVHIGDSCIVNIYMAIGNNNNNNIYYTNRWLVSNGKPI